MQSTSYHMATSYTLPSETEDRESWLVYIVFTMTTTNKSKQVVELDRLKGQPLIG